MAKYVGDDERAGLSLRFKVSIVQRRGETPVVSVTEEVTGKKVPVKALSIDCPGHQQPATLTITVASFDLEAEIDADAMTGLVPG